MEIGSGNAVVSTTDRVLEFAPQKSASADSSNLNESRGTYITKADITKFEKEIISTDSNVTGDFLQAMIDKVNKQLNGTDREFNYSIHKKTGQFMVKIVDRETKEVIREIPPEKTLDAVAKMWDLMGIFVDRKT